MFSLAGLSIAVALPMMGVSFKRCSLSILLFKMNNMNLTLSDIDYARLMGMQPPADLRAELERAIVIPKESIWPDVVTMGARVSYRDLETDRVREIEIVYPDEADLAKGRISVMAPVGAALIGLSVGHQIDWDFPDGSVHRLVVESVVQPEIR